MGLVGSRRDAPLASRAVAALLVDHWCPEDSHAFLQKVSVYAAFFLSFDLGQGFLFSRDGRSLEAVGVSIVPVTLERTNVVRRVPTARDYSGSSTREAQLCLLLLYFPMTWPDLIRTLVTPASSAQLYPCKHRAHASQPSWFLARWSVQCLK